MVAVFTGLGAGLERGSANILGGRGLLGSSSLGRGGESVYLNAANGGLVLARQDEFLVGRGPDVAVARTYNSQGSFEDGDNWRQSTERRIVSTGPGFNTISHTAQRISADGSAVTYTYDDWGDGYYYRATDGAGAYDKLEYDSGDWIWTDGSTQITERYAAVDGGFISEQRDLDDNIVSFTYIGGKLDKVATANNVTGAQSYIQYGWSGDNLTSLATFYTDLTGAEPQEVQLTRTTYAYDGSDRLSTVTVDLTPEITTDSQTYVTTYTYVDTSDLIATITQTDGSSLAISYDGQGRVGALAQTVDGDARTTSIAYHAGYTEITDPRGMVTTLYYDADGQLTKISAPPAYAGAPAQEVEFDYDALGNLTSVTHAGGGETSYVYDAHGNATQITDSNGNVTTRAYDANNRVTLETRVGSSATSSSQNLYTRYVYDSEGHLRFDISPEGHVSEYRYDAAGALTHTVVYTEDSYEQSSTLPTESEMETWCASRRASSEVQRFAYDARGNLTDSYAYSVADETTGEGLTEGGYRRTSLVYDQAGLLLSRHTAAQSAETFVYDGMGRLIASTDLAGGTTNIVFADAARTTTITTGSNYVVVSTFNAAGELISKVDSGASTNGGTTEYVYDKNGQLRRIGRPNGVGGSQEFAYTYFLYDGVGRKIADIGQGGEVTEYRYDLEDRLVATVRYGSVWGGDIGALDDPDTEVEDLVDFPPAPGPLDIWQWSVYDSGGRVIETLLGDGSVSTYGYDESDRLITTTNYFNKLASVSAYMTAAPTSVVLPTADSRDRVVRTFYDGDGRVIGALDGEGYLSQIIYDSAGRKIQEIGYAGATSLSLRATGDFDELLGSISVDAAADISTHFAYDGQGLLRFVVDPTGHLTQFVYWDGVEGNESQASGLVRQTIGYAVPLEGNDFEYETLVAATETLGSEFDRTSHSVYNEHAQLSYQLDAAGAVVGYTYDSAGRITKVLQFADEVDVDDVEDIDDWLSDPAGWADLHDDGARVTRSYYNARGELAFRIDPEGYVSQFEYDGQGRLINSSQYSSSIIATDESTLASIAAANKGNAIATSYRYNALGRLWYTVDSAGTYRQMTYYANGELQCDIIALGHDEERWIAHFYDQGGRQYRVSTAYLTADQSDTYYAYDGMGNVAWITDPRSNSVIFSYDKAGRVITKRESPEDYVYYDTHYEYDAFGRSVKTTDPLGNTSYTYFDKLGRATLEIDAAGYATETSYTAFGEVASVTARAIATTGAAIGNPPTITPDAADATTTFVYNAHGELISRTNALAGSVTYQRDAFGNIVKTVDALGNASYNYYDALGRVWLAIDAEGYATETTYDARGLVQSVTRYAEEAGEVDEQNLDVPPDLETSTEFDATTTFEYDSLRRLLSETDALGGVTSHEYDARGNRVRTVNALGGVTVRVFDRLDRLVEQTVWFTGDLDEDAPHSTTSFTYDANGNLTQKIEAVGAPEQRTTIYAYDELNRLTTVTHDAIDADHSATGVLANVVESFYYDATGNLIEKRDAMGARTLYWYDALGRATFELAASEIVGGDQRGTLTQTTYDANGNVVERRVYADLVTLPTTAGGAAPSEPGAYRRTLYEYDKLNRLVRASTPSVNVAYVNGSGALNVQTAVTLETAYGYDANGNVTVVEDANGGLTLSYYDNLGRKIAQVDGAVITPQDFPTPLPGGYLTSWTYDSNGNVSSEIRYANVLPAIYNSNSLPDVTTDATNDRQTDFTYDKMGRRLSETRVNVAVFNGTSGSTTTAVTIGYSYNALGEVTKKVEATGDAINYEYDLAGRLTKETRTLDGQVHLYTDAFGADVTPSVLYAYNGLNDLIQSTAVGDEDPEHPELGYHAADRITTFEYGLGGRLLSKTDAAGAVRTYIYDTVGRVVREQYTRTLPLLSGSAPVTVAEAVGYDYDLMGRVTAQGLMGVVGGAYTRNLLNAGGGLINDTVVMKYNAFGEVSERGVNGVYAEKFEYDAAGRLTRSNAGDGAWKYFMYDAVGNQALMIESVGADLNAATTDTLAEVLALWSSTSAIATTNVAGVVATLTHYDDRNLATAVFEPQRQLSATGALVNLKTARVYNAFGEVVQEADANGFDGSGDIVAANSIQYAYNTMGRLVEITSPGVSITSEAGVVTANYQPTEHRYYDVSGRLVATRDANANLTRYTLLAGSGYNGAAALNASTIFADGGETINKYDVMGDLREIDVKVDAELYRTTTQEFDAMGRVTSVAHAGGLVDYYVYDELGQRTKHWNNQYGDASATLVERTVYDQQGRIVDYFAMGGDETTYAYVWSGAVATPGMATFGGWVQTTTYANTMTLVETSDVFGHAVATTDLGGHVLAFTYDDAGRLTQRSADVGDPLDYVYLNSGRLSTVSDGTRTSTFTYDAVGNVLTEKLVSGAQTFKDMTATYDALGRQVTWSEANSTLTPGASIAYEYDANSNIRRISGTNYTLNDQGVTSSSTTAVESWFRYDSLNRVTTQRGHLDSGAITGGVQLSYNLAGDRVQAIYPYSVRYISGWLEEGLPHPLPIYSYGASTKREDYFYDDAGRVVQVDTANGDYDPEEGEAIPPGEDPDFSATFDYDLMGRLIAQDDGEDQYARSVTYNAKGQIESDVTDTLFQGKIYHTATAYGYGTAGTSSYALGAVKSMVTTNSEIASNGTVTDKPQTSTTNDYVWWDGAMLSHTAYDSNLTSGSNTIYHTYYTISGFGGDGQLTSATIADGRPRTVTWRNDLNGQVIRRDESDNISSQGDPHEVWHRFVGKQIGYVGNNGTVDTNYESSIMAHTMISPGPGAFRYGASTGSNYANFDMSWAPITALDQGSTAGVYTVQSGDTLMSIAAALWGDGSLWYKLAEANGLSSESVLVEGQVLTIPPGVQRAGNSSETFRPYDPAEVMGATSPTVAKAPPSGKKKGCGGLGQLLLVVIAVVVTVASHGTLSNAFNALFQVAQGATGTAATASAVAAGATSAAAGSVVSQSVGVATGIQDRFSWNAVGLAAIGGGVSAGLNPSGALPTSVGEAATRAITANVISQGIGVVTGLQDKFSWAGVAAAGVGAGFGHAVGASVGATPLTGDVNAANIVANVMKTTATTLASAATRSLIEGSDFGDNILAALPDVIGQTIGEAIAGGISKQVEKSRNEREAMRRSEADQEQLNIERGMQALDEIMGPTDLFGELDAEFQTLGWTDDGSDLWTLTAGAAAIPAEGLWTFGERLAGGAIRIGMAEITAGAILGELANRANERAQVMGAIDRFGLNIDDTGHLLAARAFVWASNDLVSGGRFTGDGTPWQRDAGAQAVMLIELANPGTAYHADLAINHSSSATDADRAALALLEIAAAGAITDAGVRRNDDATWRGIVTAVAGDAGYDRIYRARPPGVAVNLQTTSARARAAVAGQITSGRWQAHHLVPAEAWSNYQFLAQLAYQDGWRVDAPSNVIALPADRAGILPQHLGSHPDYNRSVNVQIGASLTALGHAPSPLEARAILFTTSNINRAAIVVGAWHPRVH